MAASLMGIMKLVWMNITSSTAKSATTGRSKKSAKPTVNEAVAP